MHTHFSGHAPPVQPDLMLTPPVPPAHPPTMTTIATTASSGSGREVQ
jgi:hypothetical protein